MPRSSKRPPSLPHVHMLKLCSNFLFSHTWFIPRPSHSPEFCHHISVFDEELSYAAPYMRSSPMLMFLYKHHLQ